MGKIVLIIFITFIVFVEKSHLKRNDEYSQQQHDAVKIGMYDFFSAFCVY